MEKLEEKTTSELFTIFIKIINILQEKEIIRSKNLIGEYAEYLFHEAFKWKLEKVGNKYYDAKNNKGERIQIKARWKKNKLRNVHPEYFDKLAIIRFDENLKVEKGVIIPSFTIKGYVYRNSRLSFSKKLLEKAAIEDVTEELRNQQNEK